MSEGALVFIILIICLFTGFIIEAVMTFVSRQSYSEIYIDDESGGDDDEDIQ